jgi:dimethylargininase
MTIFRNAIVCEPSASITDAISSSGYGKPDYVTAMKQHERYVRVLEDLGVKVRVLPPKTSFPDSTFIEDVALCTKACAIITRPAVLSRRGETDGMKEILAEYYSQVEEIFSPGTLEAGDVMMTGSHFFIGISRRTNSEGADQLIKILGKYNLTGSKISLNDMLHLKSGVSWLEKDLLVSGEFINCREFENYRQIPIDDDEKYAANSLWINGKVLVPDGFPGTRKKIEKAGYETIPVDVTEFRKADGGLSCLSLRF